MSLRQQLLLVSLITLALPWAGCQYVREMENALRQGQEDALLASARAVAGALSGRQDLLYRHGELLSDALHADKTLYAQKLALPVTLDAYADDWNASDTDYRVFPGADEHRVRMLLARDQQWLYLYAEIQDDRVVYEHDSGAASDRLLLRYQDAGGAFRDLVISTDAPGWVSARPLASASLGAWALAPDPLDGVRGEWQETAAGYNLEVRLPMNLIGLRLGFAVVDADRPGEAAAVSEAGTVRYDPSEVDVIPGLLVYRLPALDAQLERFVGDTYRLAVTDLAGWQVGGAGVLDLRARGSRIDGALDGLYRFVIGSGRSDDAGISAAGGRLSGPPLAAALAGEDATAWYLPAGSERAIASAVTPVIGRDGLLGAVVLEQDSEAILTLTNRALARLINFTMLAMVLAVALLLGFATWLSVRIRRLRDAAEQAVDAEGQIRAGLPGGNAVDELGDLSRSFSTLLRRLDEYNSYLRSLASKLSHELRTPLAVVDSSLEHLQDEALPVSAEPYAERARQGSQRLRAIVNAMSAASHAEQSVRNAEQESFDLQELVRGNLQGYRDIYADRTFDYEGPEAPCPCRGAPDLISQMLDKLIDNAVDFSPTDSSIRVALRAQPGNYQLSVSNEGPVLPETMRAQLFDPMVTLREGKSERPHLGFGLYIVRLIVEAHRGAIEAENLDNGSGVRFVVSLPRGA